MSFCFSLALHMSKPSVILACAHAVHCVAVVAVGLAVRALVHGAIIVKGPIAVAVGRGALAIRAVGLVAVVAVAVVVRVVAEALVAPL